MPAKSCSENLNPASLVSEALKKPLQVFLSFYPNNYFLLVRLDKAASDLMAGLASTMNVEADAGERAKLGVLNFHTVVQPDADPRRKTDRPSPAIALSLSEQVRVLKQRALAAPYFAIALRKRAGIATFSNRISVGRARNTDVVLRHSSVSKFHAWFETDQNRELYVADAGSRNRTCLKNEFIEPRRLVRVDPGDEIRFGSIATMVCSAEAFWKLVRDDAA